jgi:hypothetical protein
MQTAPRAANDREGERDAWVKSAGFPLHRRFKLSKSYSREIQNYYPLFSQLFAFYTGIVCVVPSPSPPCTVFICHQAKFYQNHL